MTEVLRIEGLSKSFGALEVGRDLSLKLGTGDRVALIGPNGAGKTTFINLVTGAVPPSSGHVFLAGHDITTMSMVGRVRRGLVRSFQVTRVFRARTVAENVRLAVLQRERRTGRIFIAAASMADTEVEVAAVLDTLELGEFANRTVREIAYGQQRLLEIAIALALKPKVLLLDEPSAGVSREESPRILGAINNLPMDIAVLMIEHDMDLVFRFATRVVVMAAGEFIFNGGPGEVASSPHVREAYLGSYARARG